ncbi:HNH endonuclease [Cytobacillus depressus]|uniref:HNH endonuclease n=1 Tax=Cytobacillus depressus TaxID=1602942 RepID=A0A6L3V0K4_9BACI|nr:HNH endonuclease signature motif containing protein [Cytobacillus depressus]KAB2328987.1 HNH endonuclease [Cytobacillus depressus]
MMVFDVYKIDQIRNEFKSIRNKYFKDKPKMCSRCFSSKIIHLHHKKAIADGGTNDNENLVPLCKGCHDEWHYVEGSIEFEDFLETISGHEFIIIQKNMDQFIKSFKDAPFEEGMNLLKKSVLDMREMNRGFALAEFEDRTGELRL